MKPTNVLKISSANKPLFAAGVKIHFVGIGGVGMSGLAELLHSSGSTVTGSDLTENNYTKRLKQIGITVYQGHKPEHIGSAEIIVQSSAVPEDNIEILTAKKQNLSVIKRPEALAEVMRLKRGLVIAGTHGKTTTTHLLSSILIHSEKDPTVVIGGKSQLFNSTARLGKGEWFVAESDESDGGFKYLSPEIAVLTNIDNDHLDYYGSFEKLKTAFLNFILKVPFYGSVIAWGDQEIIKDLLSGIKQKVIFYGFKDNNHFKIKKLKGQQYELFVNNNTVGAFTSPLPGEMNALNALAACTAAMTMGLSFEKCQSCFQNFQGVDRRFQKKGDWKGVEVYDDYAHHPVEIEAILSAFREKFGNSKRLVVLFEPHRFSRTLACWSHFLKCFNQADQVFLLDIYPASEPPIAGINSQRLAEEINQQVPCTYCPAQDILFILSKSLKEKDILITMGAGSVYKYGETLLNSKSFEVCSVLDK